MLHCESSVAEEEVELSTSTQYLMALSPSVRMRVKGAVQERVRLELDDVISSEPTAASVPAQNESSISIP